MSKERKNKASDGFAIAIRAMLDRRAADDPLFAERYANEKKSIDECCAYIIGEVSRMRVEVLTDDEVLGLAVHYYDEADVKVGSAPSCKVVVPAMPEVTAARKAELEQLAEERYIDEVLSKLRNGEPKKAKPKKVADASTQSLF